MKKISLILALALVCATSFAQGTLRPSKQTMAVVDQALEFSLAQTQNLYAKIENDKALFPRTVKDNKLVTSKESWWTSGFYPGTMWYLYEYSRDAKIKAIAEDMTDRVLGQQFTTDNHDVGFLINCSAGNGYRLTSKQEYRTALINASKSLATRFSDTVDCTRSWDGKNWNYVVIIDNMMNLELFNVGSSLSGDKSYYEMAQKHANKTMKCHFREDGSSYHFVDYDPNTGEPIRKGTHQGKADDSSWSRGQGWGLYGYTMMYRQTGKQEYLNHAIKIANFIINHPNLPKDKIPYWDFDAKGGSRTERDASAGALMASALIELSTYVDQDLASKYLNVAQIQVRSLASRSYRSQRVGDNQGFILTKSVGFLAKNSEVHAPLSYADYYFVEALMRLRRLDAGEPVVDLFTVYSENDDRAAWLSAMDRVARPVLRDMSKGELRKNMNVVSGTPSRPREHVTYLEALGRLITGIGPWTNLPMDDMSKPENRLREEYLSMIAKAIANGVDKNSPDYLNFTEDRQPLVDAAFLSHGLLRSPAIWNSLDATTQQRLVEELKSTRVIAPLQNNWLLFSAMVELALKEFTGEWQVEVVETALEKHKEWYKGDGWYGDGKNFHMDYYNSFVIQPMMYEIVEYMSEKNIEGGDFVKTAAARYSRFATQQEMMISPEGTYPALGRSIVYRFGAFHALSDVALRKMLNKNINPASVRCALTSVINKQINMPNTFDKDGWLNIGFAGHQPSLSESYIATGSLYLCSAGFIALGLDENDEFWSGKPAMWSSQRAWSGLDIKADKAIKN